MGSNKKVLHVVGGMDIGGTETMLMNLYRQVYSKIQFDFISYYEKDAYYDEEIKALGGNIIKTEAPNKIGQLKAISNLCSIIKKGNYDVVHAHTLFNCGIAMVAAKLSGVKVRISHAHTNLDLGSNFIKKYYFSVMRSLINTFSTDFAACSDSAGRYLFGEKIINSKNYKIIHNYVDYNKFLECKDYTSIRESLGIKQTDIVVGHIGRFVEAKNHKYLIEVLNTMIKNDTRIKAILVGDGHLRSEVEEQVEELGIKDNIYFLGLRDDINVILNNADLFIFPSIYEGLGLVMLEAQAAGLPCLVSQAIQPEANLGLDLVTQMKLEEGTKLWAKKAVELVGEKNINQNKIMKAFNDKGYELNQIVDNLLEVYKFN